MAIGIIIAAARYVVYPAYRRIKGAIVKTRDRQIANVVQPLLDAQTDRFEAAFTVLGHNQAELSETMGVVVTRVDALEDTVSNGMQDDITYLRSRLDDLYDHLIP